MGRKYGWEVWEGSMGEKYEWEVWVGSMGRKYGWEVWVESAYLHPLRQQCALLVVRKTFVGQHNRTCPPTNTMNTMNTMNDEYNEYSEYREYD